MIQFQWKNNCSLGFPFYWDALYNTSNPHTTLTLAIYTFIVLAWPSSCQTSTHPKPVDQMTFHQNSSSL